MVPEIDIWRCARLLIKRYGADAKSEAERRAEDLLAEGETRGHATFLRIARAVEELQRERPAKGQPLH
jgi:triphosphoribosyl-dephospho-CoA synthetase